jgi:hypothetical protein
VGKVIVNLPPGAMVPESHEPVFDVEVCVTVSLLVHVTLLPTETLIGFGAYAVVVSVDEPLTIETELPDGAGEGPAGEDDPHPNDIPSTSAANMIRIFNSVPPAPRSANVLPVRGDGLTRTGLAEFDVAAVFGVT